MTYGIFLRWLSLVYETTRDESKTTSRLGSLQVQLVNVVAELQEYGLTRNEARVLVFLAKTGPSKASDVALAVQINRTETYRTVRNLQRRGLVEATLERPVRFQSVPFDRCLQILIDEEKTKLEVLEQRGGSLRQQFQSIYIEPFDHDVERFQVIEGRFAIEQRLRNMCSQAKQSVMAVFSSPNTLRAENSGLFGMLGDFAKTGLRVKLIAEVTQANLRTVERLRKTIEIRHLDLKTKPVPKVSIVDDSEALFEITTPDESRKSSNEIALWINSRPFVKNLQAYFGEMWAAATPVASHIEALKKGIEPDAVSILKDRVEVSDRLRQMISSATRSIDIWTTMRGIQALADFLMPLLRDAKVRGAKIRVIAPITSENTESARKLVPVSQLRYSESLGRAEIIIADGRQLMLYQRTPEDVSSNVGVDIGIWTNSIRFTETMSESYNAMWKGMFAIYAPNRRGLPR